MKEKESKESGGGRCYYHPKEVDVIGVCHLCLNERLLVLAAKQQSRTTHSSTSSSSFKFNKAPPTAQYRPPCSTNKSTSTKSYIHNITSLPKLFALGSFFTPASSALRRRHGRNSDLVFYDTAADDPDSTSTSFEDESFISIKFGDNGVASWDKKKGGGINSQTETKTVVKHSNKFSRSSNNSSTRSVVEHAKPRGPTSLRWRNRIRHLLQVIRLKKATKASSSSTSAHVEAVNMNHSGWIKTLRIRT